MCNGYAMWIIVFYHYIESERKKLIKSTVTKVKEETPDISEEKVNSEKVRWFNIIQTKSFSFNEESLVYFVIIHKPFSSNLHNKFFFRKLSLPWWL